MKKTVLLFVLCFFFCTLNSFEIIPSKPISYVDEEISVSISQLSPSENVTISLSSLNLREEWNSEVSCKASSEGRLELKEQLLALFASLKVDNSSDTSFSFHGLDHWTLKLTVLRESGEMQSTRLIRLIKDFSVKREIIREDGLVGIFFSPESEKQVPALLILTGSNGGISETRAKILARHGYATLALGYFGFENMPKTLNHIPLEIFQKALDWLKKHPSIHKNKVGVFGVSRGAELALLVGSYFPDDVAAVAASMPSSVAYGGLPDRSLPAWTYRDLPLPMAKLGDLKFEDDGGTVDHPICTRNRHFAGKKLFPKEYEHARIPVEKCTAPIFLISAGDDQMWPSDYFGKEIELHATSQVTHCHYPNAGHLVYIPYLPSSSTKYFHPIAKRWFEMGGNLEADYKASNDSWNKLLNFLEVNLKD